MGNLASELGSGQDQFRLIETVLSKLPPDLHQESQGQISPFSTGRSMKKKRSSAGADRVMHAGLVGDTVLLSQPLEQKA